jgi:tetratricopeptide (TPR) repeat protein
MPYRLLILALLVLAELPVDAATTLKGVILANEVGGSPIADVPVVADGANPTVSESLGRFTLEFPQKSPGDTVRVIVKKEGYVVVNDVQLETVLPADAAPLTVILAKEGDREEMARRFYRLKSFGAIEESYQKRLKELEDSRQATAAALTKLQQERDQANAAAEKASEELAKNQPGRSSDLYQGAKWLFLDGKIEEAIKLLDDEKLRQLVAQATETIEQQKRIVEDAVQAWLLKAQLFTVQFDFDSAEKAYLAAIKAGPDNFDAHFAYGAFNQELNRDQQAMTNYSQCLELAAKSKSNAELARTLANLATVYSHQNRIEEAQTEFDQAVSIYRELAQNNPETYMDDVASTLLGLGTLYWKQGRMEEAKSPDEEALQIYRELVEKNPERYSPRFAGTLNNVGVLNRDQHRFKQARSQLAEALLIFGELAQKNPEIYSRDLARALNNLGILDYTQGILDSRPSSLEDARGEFEEALQIRHKLVEKDPERDLPDLAATLTNVGTLNRDQGRLEESGRQYEEALEIRGKLVQKNPNRYLPDLAKTLLNMGLLSRIQRRTEEARQEFEKALKIYETAAMQNPKAFSTEIEGIKEHLAELPEQRGSWLFILSTSVIIVALIFGTRKEWRKLGRSGRNLSRR